MRRVLQLALVIIAVVVPSWTARGQTGSSIVNTPHNLSASGPGSVRASSEQQVCIFCHTPHHASSVQPLWNRQMSVQAYKPYASSSLDARPGQPTGTSKLCLSCHDGTIALGNIVTRDQPIAMGGGMTTLPPGHAMIGTDLSDDHPISFKYDGALAAKDPKLRNPALLVGSAVRLDHNSELQCTSCHEPHDNSRGKFLVMDNTNSALCRSCHQPDTTTIAAHTQCASCHQPHTAPSGPHLLTGETVSGTCVACHDGGTGANKGSNVAAELSKLSKHDVHLANLPVDQNHVPNGVTCNDCHESHTMQTGTAAAPLVSPKLGRIDGVNSSGAAVPVAQFEYEVCIKCHGDTRVERLTNPPIARQVTQQNTRLEFLPSAVSFHPVMAEGRNTDAPSLTPTLTPASRIGCTDCHASETTQSGSGGALGPHGSSVPFLLKARYDTVDRTAESAAAYELCYRCHERNSILGDESFALHRLHVQDAATPCSVCHDPHGISSAQGSQQNNSHLINFDTTVVSRDDGTGFLKFVDDGPRAGTCFLTCHEKAHSGLSYGGVAAMKAPVTKVVSPKAATKSPMRSLPSRRR